MLGRIVNGDDLTFIQKLADLVQQYIRPAMVLDRLARRPVTPDDVGNDPMAGDAADFKRRLNLVLVDFKLDPLSEWTFHHDPIDALRYVEVRNPPADVIYWDYAADLAEGDMTECSSMFGVPDYLIDEIADVDQDVAAWRVVLVLKAMTGLG